MADSAQGLRAALLGAVRWRNIGLFRGGRVVTVAGDPAKPLVFYFGSTGGVSGRCAMVG